MYIAVLNGRFLIHSVVLSEMEDASSEEAKMLEPLVNGSSNGTNAPTLPDDKSTASKVRARKFSRFRNPVPQCSDYRVRDLLQSSPERVRFSCSRHG